MIHSTLRWKMFDRPEKCLTDHHRCLTVLKNVWQTTTDVWQTWKCLTNHHRYLTDLKNVWQTTPKNVWQTGQTSLTRPTKERDYLVTCKHMRTSRKMQRVSHRNIEVQFRDLQEFFKNKHLRYLRSLPPPLRLWPLATNPPFWTIHRYLERSRWVWGEGGPFSFCCLPARCT